MKYILVLATVLVAVSALPHPRLVQQEWKSFKSEYVKVYDSADEEAKRLAIFQQNLIKIEEHNKLYEQGLSTFKMGVTSFADMTSEEFMAYFNKSSVQSRPQHRSEQGKLSNLLSLPDQLPKSVDWRTQNILTPVKNQGKCESGYAFAITGALEACYAMETGEKISLSEQQIIDCATDHDDNGCSGASSYFGVIGYEEFHNIFYESSYPYEAKKGVCHDGKPSPLARNGGFVDVENSHTIFCVGLTIAPVSAIVDITEKWQLYKGGVLEDSSCKPKSANHGVLVVGYNEDNQYYILKNSFGSNWGEAGYMRLSYKSPCGVEDNAFLPFCDLWINP